VDKPWLCLLLPESPKVWFDAQMEFCNWAAWYDHQPPGPRVLHVVGRCEFPTPGYSVELRRREPQGINPRELLLDCIVHAPSGVVPQVITAGGAGYREETDFEYDTVTLLPDGPSISVQDIH